MTDKPEHVTKPLQRLLGRFSRNRVPEANTGIPVDLAAGKPRPPTLQEMVQQYIRSEVSQQAEEDGYGSFEDEDDFTEEDPDTLPLTHHQVVAMDEEELAEIAGGYGIDLLPDGQVPEEGPGELSAEGPSDPTGSTEERPAEGAPGSLGGDNV